MNTLLGLQNLPYVSLIKGNLAEVDKKKLVSKIVFKYSILELDILKVFSLTVESSREIKEFVSTHPIGEIKLVVVDLDKSSTQAQNSLLYLLENPPHRVKFLLFSTSTILTTVESRSQVFCATHEPDIDKQAKSIVVAALKASKHQDEMRLEEVLRNWDDKCHKLLLEWAIESKLRKPNFFTLEELLSVTFPQGFEDNIILALSVLDLARPRISAKSILMSYIEKSRSS